MASFFPKIGSWFRDTDSGQRFEIVAIDEKQKTIEVQYYDGDISEFDIESWGSMQLIETKTPEEAYGGYEGMSSFDNEVDVDTLYGYGNPLESFEPETFNGFDDLF